MKYVKLSNIALISAGGTPNRSNNEYWNGDVPWLKISDIKGKYTNSCTEFITEEGLKNSSAKYFDVNTVLYTIFATVGETSILNFKSTTNQAIAGIKLITNACKTDYLYYYLKSIKNKVKFDSKGAAQNNINLSYLKNLNVPVMAKDKQKEIVYNLSKIEELIEYNKSIILYLEILVKSRFIEMFGDPKENPKGYEIEKIGKLFDVGSSKRVFESQWTNNGVPFYRAREIIKLSKDGFVDNELFITREMFEKYKKKYGVPKSGDMMVTGVGTLGICYIVRDSDEFYFKDGNTLWFKNKGICDVRFIRDQYETDYVREQIDTNANSSTVGTYTITNAKNTLILVPPLELQKKYVEFVELIDKSKYFGGVCCEIC